MSQSEQDELIGRIVRERKEAKDKLEIMRTKASMVGTKLKAIGHALENSPERVAFPGISSGANSLPNVHWFQTTDWPQLNDIATLGNEIRQTAEELGRLNEKARQLGL